MVGMVGSETEGIDGKSKDTKGDSIKKVRLKAHKILHIGKTFLHVLQPGRQLLNSFFQTLFFFFQF